MAVGRPNPVGNITGANDKVADNIITHAVNLERLKSSEYQKVFQLLDKLEIDLEEKIKKIDVTAVGGKARQKRFTKLLANVRATIKAQYGDINSKFKDSLKDVAKLEPKVLANGVGKAVANNPKIGVALVQFLPPPTTLQALVDDTLVMSAPVKTHWQRQAGDLVERFTDAMREGILANESIGDLVRRVRGTKANNFKDGIMNVKRYQAEALVRTSVHAVSNKARQTTIDRNIDIIKGYQWLSTLDTRTSDICKSYSGLTWDSNKNPIGHKKNYRTPPAHYNCRSVIVPMLKSFSELAGKDLTFNNRKFRKGFEDALVASGIPLGEAKKIKRGMQASMTGQVAGELTYETWLKTKSVSIQKEVLGDGRWQLWNDGKIGFVDLVDQRNNPLSLEELIALIDEGKTSIAQASKVAKDLARQEAKNKAIEQANLAVKEDKANELLNKFIGGVTGFKNHQKAYNKLSKKSGWQDLSKQEKVSAIQADVDNLNFTAKVSTIKKKIKEGKKLSPSEEKTLAGLTQDLKDEIQDLKSTNLKVSALQKSLQKEIQYTKEIFKNKVFGDNIVNQVSYIVFSTDLKDISAMEKAIARINEIKIMQKQAYIDVLSFNQEILSYSPAKLKILADEIYPDGYFSSPSTAISNFLKGEKIAPSLNVKVLKNLGEEGKVLKAQGTALADLKTQDLYINYAKEAQLKVNKKFNLLNEKAEEKLEFILTAGKGSGKLTQKKVYQKLIKEKNPILQADFVDLLEFIEQEAVAVKKLADFNSLKSVVSTKSAQGKALTKGEQKWLDSLNDEQFSEVDTAIQAKIAKAGKKQDGIVAVDEANDQQLLFSNMEQVGGQGGSNLGGTFKDKTTGIKYYIKSPEEIQRTYIEMLSARLYEMAGVRVPRLKIINIDGEIGGTKINRIGIASKIEDVDDIEVQDMIGLNGVDENFAVDAWLANWDVIGEGGAKSLNLKRLKDGSGALRLDTGGSLIYRAKGELKDFSKNSVLEIRSLRTSSINPNATEVFKNLNNDKIAVGVAKIVKITDDEIRNVVAEILPANMVDEITEKLIGRKNDLAKRFKPQLDQLNRKTPTPLAKEIVQTEKDAIKKSGANGYSLAIDKDQIEDQLIHFHNDFAEETSKRTVRAYTKIRGNVSEELTKTVRKSGTIKSGFDVSSDDSMLINTLKSIQARTAKGDKLAPYTFSNADELILKYTNVNKSINLELKGKLSVADSANLMNARSANENIIEFLEQYRLSDKVTTSTPAFYNPPANFKKLLDERGFFINRNKIEFTVLGEESAIKWTKNSKFQWKKRTFDKGEITGVTDTQGRIVRTDDDYIFVDHYTANVDGVKVTYFPQYFDGTDFKDINNFALQNKLTFEVEDAVDGHNKILDTMRKLGINAERASDIDREVVYLRKLHQVELHKSLEEFMFLKDDVFESPDLYRVIKKKNEFDAYNKTIKNISKLPIEKQKQAYIDEIKQLTGEDITQKVGYNPFGSWQANTQGRILTKRVDLDTEEFSKFKEEYEIAHVITARDKVDVLKQIFDNGGTMTPTVDKLRKGIDLHGMSPEEDLATGGADYFFTRIKEKARDSSSNVLWKADHLKRLDTHSYSRDRFGNTVKAGESFGERAYGIKTLKLWARRNDNETNFKNGLSLFDNLNFIRLDSPTEVEEIINYLKERGYTNWVDGRALDEVIMTFNTYRRKFDEGSLKY
tara:strand:- start:339 stop:5408 length:5070 start_codon:yes stop_codon:yes gene_type:complete